MSSDRQIIDLHYKIGFAEALIEIDENFDINALVSPTKIGPLPFKVQNNKIFLENVETTTKENAVLGRSEQLLIERRWEKYEKERDELISGNRKRKFQKKKPIPRIDIELDDDDEDLMTILERDELEMENNRRLVTMVDPEPYINGRLSYVAPELPFNQNGDFSEEDILTGIPVLESTRIDLPNVPIISGISSIQDDARKDIVDSIPVPATPVRLLNISEANPIPLLEPYQPSIDTHIIPEYSHNIHREVESTPSIPLDPNRTLNRYLTTSQHMVNENKKIKRLRTLIVDEDDIDDDETPRFIISDYQLQDLLKVDIYPRRIMDLDLFLDYIPPEQETELQYNQRIFAEALAKLNSPSAGGLEDTNISRIHPVSAPVPKYMQEHGKYRHLAASVIQTMHDVCNMVTDFNNFSIRLDDFRKEFPRAADNRNLNYLEEMEVISIDHTYIQLKKY